MFGLGFTLEGISFFTEAIFIGIYVYGWDRMSPRLHMLAGLPIVIAAGVAGSLMVISVNGWMNHPGGFSIVDGRVVDVHPWSAAVRQPHVLARARPHVPGGLHRRRLRRRLGLRLGLAAGTPRPLRADRARAVPLAAAALAAPVQVVVGDWAARDVARYQPVKLAAFEGLATTTSGAPIHVLGWYTDGGVRYGIEIPRLLSLLAKHDPERDDRRARQRAAGRATARQRRPRRLPDHGRDRNAPRRARRCCCSRPGGDGAACPDRAGSTGRSSSPGRSRSSRLIAGWVTTEVGRQPWVVYRVMRTRDAVTGASGIPFGYATLVARLRRAGGRRLVGAAAAGREHRCRRTARR